MFTSMSVPTSRQLQALQTLLDQMASEGLAPHAYSLAKAIHACVQTADGDKVCSE